ncbi:carbonic anhydrase [Glycomyces sp. TRM65418]|uniref:carbonic anhydrase n=1 Tax=Glycomyces sp. TRM65418 TaxID=2867006 RepID=UPI001CE60DE6|nr:carbonic anhydrase [Glycomyces sp. TRM65418]MCC3762255.1 carbonic anhydrase [Glycomyces sp. TRM65418]QZD56312.1 carbonic anhydrase [Glycomyces sp. TRM65418]
MNTLNIRGDRRKLITGAGAIGAGAIALLALDACGSDGGKGAAAQTPTAPALDTLESADEIWQVLLDGNQRWADGDSVHPHTDAEWRESLVEGQSPRAAVFSCVDSRVSPELVFDTGVGDLMVTRTAGNVFDPLVSESVSYGPAALESPLLVVLGHQRCGAVTAAHEALLAEEEGAEPEEHHYALPETVEALRAAYEASKGESGDPVDAMVKANVLLTVQALSEHPNLAELVADGELTVVGGVYSLETGVVTEIA